MRNTAVLTLILLSLRAEISGSEAAWLSADFGCGTLGLASPIQPLRSSVTLSDGAAAQPQRRLGLPYLATSWQEEWLLRLAEEASVDKTGTLRLRGGASGDLKPRNPLMTYDPAPPFTEDQLQAILEAVKESELGSNDLVVAFWQEVYPSIIKNVRTLIKAAEKAMEHAAAVSFHVLQAFDEKAESIHILLEKAEELQSAHSNFNEEHEAPIPEIEELTNEFDVLQKSFQHQLVSSAGSLIVLLRQFRTVQSCLDELRRLEEGGVLEELEEYLDSLPDRRGLNLNVQQLQVRMDRDMNRLIMDFQLRYLEVERAMALAESRGLSLPETLPKFQAAAQVLHRLKNKELIPVLKWCQRHKEMLQEAKGDNWLVLQIHMQQAMELARKSQTEPVIDFVTWWADEMLKRHSSRASQTHYNAPEAEEWQDIEMQALKRVTASLAFQPYTEADSIRGLYSEARWTQLEDKVKEQAYLIFGPGLRHSLLNSIVLVGLTVLKTKNQYTPAFPRHLRQPDRALHSRSRLSKAQRFQYRRSKAHDDLYRLAKNLPHMEMQNSIMKCSFTRQTLDERDPACSLPNGHLVAKSVVEQLADDFYGVDSSLAAWLELDGAVGDFNISDTEANCRVSEVVII